MFNEDFWGSEISSGGLSSADAIFGPGISFGGLSSANATVGPGIFSGGLSSAGNILGSGISYGGSAVLANYSSEEYSRGGRSSNTDIHHGTHKDWFGNRCSSIASGDLLFTNSGNIDHRSAAVRSNAVSFNQHGFPRANCAAIKRGDLYVRPSNMPANSERKPFTQSEIDRAWNRADRIPGTNPDLYRNDRVGNVLYRPSYGGNTGMSWEVDHCRALAAGGQMHHANNHQALQHQQNASKGSKPSKSYFDDCKPMGTSAVHAPNVDYRSSSVHKGELCFKPDGTVDQRSSAVRSGNVRVTQTGAIDGRSAAVKRGDVIKH